MDTFNVHTWGRGSVVAERPEEAEYFPQEAEYFPPGLGPVPGRRRITNGKSQASGYLDMEDGSVLEPNVLRVVGHPAVRIFKDADNSTVIALRRNIARMEELGSDDLAFIEQFGERVLGQLKAMSRGPLTKKDLRRLGHPFGYAKSWAKGDSQFKGRRVPGVVGGKSLNHVKGVRGSVPSLSVINRQSGDFEKSWHWDWTRDEKGFEVRFWNTQPYAWLLAHGTMRMQPHGPWTYAPLQHLRQLDGEIQRAIRQARSRQIAEQMTDNIFGLVE
ncbi:MAG TPA: hypothetical protein VGB77_22180 [Abditibacteriaceae bacterium]|jgi:hypothetical protein